MFAAKMPVRSPCLVSHVIISSGWAFHAHAASNIGAASTHVGECDETKCRNAGDGPLGGFGCWAPVGGEYESPNATAYDEMTMFLDALSYGTALEDAACWGNFEARLVPAVGGAADLGFVGREEEGGNRSVYYTCCSLNHTGPAPSRQCSEDACSSPDWLGGTDCWADGPAEAMICASDPSFGHPRKTGATIWDASWTWSQYTCCRSPGDDGSPPLRRALAPEIVRIVLAAVALCASLFLLCAIMSSALVRGSTYNLYLVFLTLPDAVFAVASLYTGSCAISGAVINCHFSIFTVYFYASANMWLNGVIAHQVYVLLSNSFKRRRTGPPSRRLVYAQTGSVYLLSAMVGVTSSLIICGNIVLPTYFSGPHGKIVLATAFLKAIPLLYIFYVCVRIWWGGLLPRSGRLRVLSIYFMRIVAIFVVIWIPSVTLRNVEASSSTEGVHYIYVSLLLLQAPLTVAFSLSKPDVGRAALDLLRCRCNWKREGRDYIPSRIRRWFSSAQSLPSDQSAARSHSFASLDCLEAKHAAVKGEGGKSRNKVHEAEDSTGELRDQSEDDVESWNDDNH